MALFNYYKVIARATEAKTKFFLNIYNININVQGCVAKEKDLCSAQITLVQQFTPSILSSAQEDPFFVLK